MAVQRWLAYYLIFGAKIGMNTSAVPIAGQPVAPSRNCTDVSVSLHIDSRKRPSGSKLARLMMKAVRSMTGDSPPAQRRALYLARSTPISSTMR
jgi:hypothetical protein